MRAHSDGSARWVWWAIGAAAALLAASQWLHAPSVDYLVSFIVATVAAAVGVRFVQRSQRTWAFVCSAALAVAAVLAIPAQRQLWLLDHDWEGWRRSAVRSGFNPQAPV